MPTETAPRVDGFKVNALPDSIDLRDRYYEPSLVQLRDHIDPPDQPDILDQGEEGACTGFGLAAVINLLETRAGRPVRVSPRMLYEMAKRHDEWEGEDYGGSSCRGAIKGWYHMGVCTEALWPYSTENPGSLSVEAARDAFNRTIGAYYRLRPDVVDFHAALNEVGAIFVSARVHRGWGSRYARNGVIPFTSGARGGHAFAVVGYNDKGFWVQNSWGPTWGRGGLALWSYEDWKENVYDAWVFRLALPTPQIFPGRRPADPEAKQGEHAAAAPVRNEIMGHFAHFDDGALDTAGSYWSTLDDVRQTAELVAGKAADYPHVLFYAHGGLNSVEASAKRIRAMKSVFKANGIYPFHFMYDTGLGEELKDVILRRGPEAASRMGALSDGTDWLLEKLTRAPGRAVWREMKRDAESPWADDTADGTQVLQAFLTAMTAAGSRQQLHVVGHSTGAVLQGHALTALRRLSPGISVATCSLFAPASRLALFESHFRPLLAAGTIARMRLYCLDRELEQNDHVAAIYRKSLLWLVSNAYEEAKHEPLLGMQVFHDQLDLSGLPADIVYSHGPKGREKRSTATSHGGFDNDPATMNDVLTSILGTKPSPPFTAKDLDF